MACIFRLGGLHLPPIPQHTAFKAIRKNHDPSNSKSFGQLLPKDKKVVKIPVHVFDRYEIHIQAVVHFINRKLITFNPHLHKIIFENYIQYLYITNTCQKNINLKNRIFEKNKSRTYDGYVFQTFRNFQFLRSSNMKKYV